MTQPLQHDLASVLPASPCHYASLPGLEPGGGLLDDIDYAATHITHSTFYLRLSVMIALRQGAERHSLRHIVPRSCMRCHGMGWDVFRLLSGMLVDDLSLVVRSRYWVRHIGVSWST